MAHALLTHYTLQNGVVATGSMMQQGSVMQLQNLSVKKKQSKFKVFQQRTICTLNISLLFNRHWLKAFESVEIRSTKATSCE